MYFSSHFTRLDFSLAEKSRYFRQLLRPKAPLGADYMIRDLIGSDSPRLPIVIGRLLSSRLYK